MRSQNQEPGEVRNDIIPLSNTAPTTEDSALLRFTQWGVKVSKTGTMIIWGDDAEAQNGFGVWLKVNYSCEVDSTSKKIVNVTMDQGRLPDPTVY